MEGEGPSRQVLGVQVVSSVKESGIQICGVLLWTMCQYLKFDYSHRPPTYLPTTPTRVILKYFPIHARVIEDSCLQEPSINISSHTFIDPFTVFHSVLHPDKRTTTAVS